MLDFTNTLGLSSLCNIVLHQVLPDTCPLMSIERDASKTINEGMLTCCWCPWGQMGPQSSHIAQIKVSGMTMSSLLRDTMKSYGSNMGIILQGGNNNWNQTFNHIHTGQLNTTLYVSPEKIKVKVQDWPSGRPMFMPFSSLPSFLLCILIQIKLINFY